MKKAISLVLVTAETCQLKCYGCPAGRREKLEIGQMTTEMADRIMTKAKAESHVLTCCLYYYNEPLLLKNLLELVGLTKKHGLYCLLSTNLNTFRQVPELMAMEPENLIVSLSGWSQATYERYHVGGDCEKVKRYMVDLAALRRPGTFLRMGWHQFKYNAHEEPVAREFAREHGYSFSPYRTGVLPLQRVHDRWADGQVDPAELNVAVPLAEAKVLCEQRKHWRCKAWQGVAVFPDGTLCHCLDYAPDAKFPRKDLFKTTIPEVLDGYQTDPRCIKCRSVGGHIYAAQEYTVPLHSPYRYAEMAYKALGLQPVVQRAFPKLWRRAVEGHYVRAMRKDNSGKG